MWRVEDWAPVAKVASPFLRGYVSMTFSLRLGWSPDGQHLAAVNSYQSPCHTAPLLDRRSWTCDLSLVGHSGGSIIMLQICFTLQIDLSCPMHWLSLRCQPVFFTGWLSGADL